MDPWICMQKKEDRNRVHEKEEKVSYQDIK
jgi:hypothetical protein